ncbi:MAG: molecular chaperone DnaJ [Myxococcota bacterium]
MLHASVAKRDYYEVLGVPRDAPPDELKKAYRRLARELHPDRNPGDPAAEESFKEASEAYRVLSDSEQRRRYDRLGHAAFGGDGSAGFDPADLGGLGEILDGLFGEVFGGRRRRRSGRDLTYELKVSFVEAALGVTKHVEIERPAPCVSCKGSGAAPGTKVSECPVCKGRGEVRSQRGFLGGYRSCAACNGLGTKIHLPCAQCEGRGINAQRESLEVRLPAGVEDGAVRTLRGAGEATASGAGDLHVTVRVAPHELFGREGADVLCTVPVSFPQAVLGATLEVPTLEAKVQMKLPPGTQSGKVFRLRGKGIPVYGGMGKGDQLVTILVEVPAKVTKKQRKLIEELAAELGEDSMPQQAGFLDKLKRLFD